MDEDQFKMAVSVIVKEINSGNRAFLNETLDVFKQVIQELKRDEAARIKDHDVLTEMKTMLKLALDEFKNHKEESVQVRDNNRRNTEHIDGCIKERHDQVIKETEKALKDFKKLYEKDTVRHNWEHIGLLVWMGAISLTLLVVAFEKFVPILYKLIL